MIADTKPAKKSTSPKRRDIPRMRDAIADTLTPGAVHAGDDQVDSMVTKLLQDEAIVALPIDQLERHPRNRTIDPQSPEICDLRDSIVAHGQREPMRVRRLAPGVDRYQILSGERRYTALRSAGIGYARCIIVVADDAAALAEVAIANSHRQDLNPIQRAELMQMLMQPEDEGGSGMTLLQAGKIFGLNSESGCKNALRMLRLPAKIRDLVIDGRLPERVARRLIPYMVTDEISKAIADDLTHPHFGDENMLALWQDELGWIEECLRDLVRPLSPDVKKHYGYGKGEHPALFDWQDNHKLTEQLKIIELPWSIDYDPKTRKDRIELRKFATNVKLWDKLNDPLVEKAIEAGKAKSKSTSKGGKNSAEPVKQTPAQLAAEAKRKAAEAERRLDTFSAEWLDRLLRCSLADRSSDDSLVALTLPWMVGQCQSHELRVAHEQALHECQVNKSKGKASRSVGPIDTLEMLPAVARAATAKEFDVMAAFWRVLLWPVTRLVGDSAAASRLTPAGELPDKIPQLGYLLDDHFRQLGALAKVSAETAWRDGATDGTDQRRLISVWLCRHTKDQLHKLRSELHVTEGSSTMGRDELAGCVLNAHRPGRPLPLPKRLQKLSAP